MERHIQVLLNRLSCISITMATITLSFLILRTPETCILPNTSPKPHIRFPKSSCDSSHRELISLERKNKRLWSTKAWQEKVSSYTQFFHSLQDLNFLNNNTRVLCVSAGAGHEVMAVLQLGVKDVTGVEIMDSPPLVSRADPHNLPFFDGVFDMAFSAHFDKALFPWRYAKEMERTVRAGGVCVLVVDECSDEEAREIAGWFQKSRFVGARNVTLIGSEMTRIIIRIRIPP